MPQTHKLSRSDIDLGQLTAEISSQTGRDVALSARLPGQIDAEGAELPGVLVVLDAATGKAVDLDVRAVAALVKAHVPSPPEDRRAQLADKARSGSLTDLERDEALTLLLDE